MPDPEVHSQPHVHYVAFPNLFRDAPVTIAAQLRVPERADKAPAVVIVHGTSGVDSRGSFHAEALNGAGIATLELDMWSPRNLEGNAESGGRPETVIESLPDAFGALAYLAARSDIDPCRVGIMGFSWGGVVSMLAATRHYTQLYMGNTSLRFAAHVPFYPVCWTYNTVPGHELTDFTGAPVFIQTGECDTYDEPDSGTKLVHDLPAAAQRHITATVYPGATHAFDRLEPAITVSDPYSHLGQGGEVRMEPHPRAAAQSRRATVDFFKQAFAAVDHTGD